MLANRKLACLVFVLASHLVLPGCGTKREDSDRETQVGRLELEEISAMFKLHVDQKKRSPSKSEDLQAYHAGFAHGSKALQSGQYVIRWTVGKSGAEDAILAYSKNAPAHGGLTLLRNGTIKKMTAEQLTETLKATAGDR